MEAKASGCQLSLPKSKIVHPPGNLERRTPLRKELLQRNSVQLLRVRVPPAAYPSSRGGLTRSLSDWTSPVPVLTNAQPISIGKPEVVENAGHGERSGTGCVRPD